MIRLPPSPPQDPWSSFDDEPSGTNAGPSRSPSPLSPNGAALSRHPLYSSDLSRHDRTHANGLGVDVLSDVSRPTLKRLTSETERQVAESSRSGSERGSLDLLRMSNTPSAAEEVEVLIHHVMHNESIAGIALLYGIDVATLRKINKLWASDPVHLRTHLYVPLEACRWTKARDTFSRGPGDGQVTLTPKIKGKGKAKEQDTVKINSTGSLIDLETPPAVGREHDDFDAWEDSAREFMPSTNMNYGRASVDTTRPSLDDVRDAMDDSEVPRVLDIVRIPRSQLQFFPKHRPPESRSSFESPLRPIPNRSVGKADGPSIQNDLSTLPLPLQPRLPPPPKPSGNKFVRLRPPTAPPSNAYTTQNTIANRISSLFTIPPPPETDLFAGRRASAGSLSFSRPGSGASTPARTSTHQDVPLELRPRSSLDGQPPRRNGHFRSASASKKYD